MFLVFDIGGTNSRFALSQDGRSIGDPVIVATPQDFDAGMHMFQEISDRLRDGQKIDCAVGGIAGVFDQGKNDLYASPHLPNWVGKHLRDELSSVLKTEVQVYNDSALVGLGEATVGSGRGYPIVSYITISTGVGGVRIVNGKIDVCAYNFEPGHQVIDINNLEDGFVTWESLISGTSLRSKMDSSVISSEQFWDTLNKFVAVGLNNTIVHWSPDVVILGGGMMESSGLTIEKISQHLTKILHIYPKLPAVRRAQLGSLGGLYGALKYLSNLKGGESDDWS